MKKNVKKVRTIVLAAISATFLFTSCKKEDELVNPLVSSSTSVSQPKTPKGSSSNVVTSTKIDESDLVFVEGGTFDMGSPAGKGDGDERPQHKVTLSSYKISKYEITIEQYAKFLTAKGNQVENGSKWYQGSDFDQQGSTFKAALHPGLPARPKSGHKVSGMNLGPLSRRRRPCQVSHPRVRLWPRRYHRPT